MEYHIEPGAGPVSAPAPALIERALRDDDEAAALVRRLAAGERGLTRAVAEVGDQDAAAVRRALLLYLAHGTWQGHLLPLPPGFHAGREAHELRKHITECVCMGRTNGWHRTLLGGLGDRDVVVCQTAASLLSGCHDLAVVEALTGLLSVHEEAIRWTAAMALVPSGRPAAEALLRRIVTRELVPEMRHVSAYVLRHVPDEALRYTVAPVVQALDASTYRIETPPAAEAALRRLSHWKVLL